MRVVERSLVSAAEPGTARAVATSAAITVLADGSLLVSYSIGSDKATADLAIELRRSSDGGQTWSEPERPFSTTVDGVRGCLKSAPITRLDGDRLIVAGLWIDQEAFPGQPLFNPDTEGCLPMSIVVAESDDAGHTWSTWRTVPMPEDVGPASLTNPIMRLADGRLVLSVESNKPYLDRSKWFQRVVYLWSDDDGATWSDAQTICQDPTGRIANWDQRAAVAPDGRIVTFTWVYDFETVSYRNILRRISTDGGQTFSEPEDLGIADQPAHPAILPDGRLVLGWVDRFGSGTIKARSASAIDAPLDPASEVTVHDPEGEAEARAAAARVAGDGESTGDALVQQGTWTYGLAFGEALADGDVGLVHYAAGEQGGTEIRWARLRVDA